MYPFVLPTKQLLYILLLKSKVFAKNVANCRTHLKFLINVYNHSDFAQKQFVVSSKLLDQRFPKWCTRLDLT